MSFTLILSCKNVGFQHRTFGSIYASILYRFRVMAHFSSKVTNFNPPHLHLSPPYGVIPFEFRRELWCLKTRVTGLSCGVICVILRLAVLIQYRSVMDTHRHTTTAYTALSMASRGKNVAAEVGQLNYRTHQLRITKCSWEVIEVSK